MKTILLTMLAFFAVTMTPGTLRAQGGSGITITELRSDKAGPYYEAELFPSVPPLVMDGLRAGAYGVSGLADGQGANARSANASSDRPISCAVGHTAAISAVVTPGLIRAIASYSQS